MDSPEICHAGLRRFSTSDQHRANCRHLLSPGLFFVRDSSETPDRKDLEVK